MSEVKPLPVWARLRVGWIDPDRTPEILDIKAGHQPYAEEHETMRCVNGYFVTESYIQQRERAAFEAGREESGSGVDGQIFYLYQTFESYERSRAKEGGKDGK